MLNNYIGGGQVFLHKMRMLKQVISTTIFVSLVAGILLTFSFGSSKRNNVDWDGAITYTKAQVATYLHPVLSKISLGKSKANVDAYSVGKLWKKNMLASSVLSSHRFKEAITTASLAIKLLALQALGFGFSAGLLVFLFWSRFGKGLQDDKRKEGSGIVLTAKEVRGKLRKLNKCSDLYIGDMPLVKNMETRHFLVTGSTGSGKTNLIHILLSQIERERQSAIVIDQTGEMIAKYYNSERGDIIFNPFDERGMAWDFWSDCSTREDLELFSKILIGFNRKQSESHSDPFWENAATSVFNSCVEFLRPQNASIEEITHMVHSSDLKYLRATLTGTEAGRYLSDDSKQTASSIVSVLSSNTKPLTYLRSNNEMGSFSMKKHFANIQNRSSAWLFLAAKPSSRNLTLPLIACLTELALSMLMNIGIDESRRVWMIIDELASLSKLPALPIAMNEGRKYGLCIIAGMQSLNQLYEQYGTYGGSTIFGQFGTSFFFRNTEPAISKMISSMSGTETITRQQKNTSFGANEFRDGVSYNEHQQRKALIEADDLASLAVGECYALLPEPAVKLVKLKTKKINLLNKNEGFIATQATEKMKYKPDVFKDEDNENNDTFDTNEKTVLPPPNFTNEIETEADVADEVSEEQEMKIGM